MIAYDKDNECLLMTDMGFDAIVFNLYPSSIRVSFLTSVNVQQINLEDFLFLNKTIHKTTISKKDIKIAVPILKTFLERIKYFEESYENSPVTIETKTVLTVGTEGTDDSKINIIFKVDDNIDLKNQIFSYRDLTEKDLSKIEISNLINQLEEKIKNI